MKKEVSQMSLSVVNHVVTCVKTTAEDLAKCMMQFVLLAETHVRFLSSQEMIVLFIAVIALQVKDNQKNDLSKRIRRKAYFFYLIT